MYRGTIRRRYGDEDFISRPKKRRSYGEFDDRSSHDIRGYSTMRPKGVVRYFFFYVWLFLVVMSVQNIYCLLTP